MPRVAGVIGWPLSYTRSPDLHNAAYRACGIDAVYAAFPVRDDGVVDAVRGVKALGLLGMNVTVPYKETVLPLCDEVEPAAMEVTAVNTLVVRDGKLMGHNTDGEGFRRALVEAGIGPSQAVVLGSGGAARAVAAALRDIPVTIIARLPSLPGSLPWLKHSFVRAFPDADLVVDATSAGLTDDPYPEPVPLELLQPRAAVCSLVYHREPALLAAARARGLRTVDGAGMLVHQAALAFTLMTGQHAPLAEMWKAMRGV